MYKIAITTEMEVHAEREAQRRDAYIKHHFEVDHMDGEARDKMGFLGEFSCCSLFGIDWQDNIRDNYLTIDDYDGEIKGLKFDVKTETVPENYVEAILNKTIDDDRAYGRRLINEGQFKLLEKYDIVIFSLFIRGKMDYWYPIGYMKASEILENYLPVTHNPNGNKYPSPASAVPTSKLKPIADLLN